MQSFENSKNTGICKLCGNNGAQIVMRYTLDGHQREIPICRDCIIRHGIDIPETETEPFFALPPRGQKNRLCPLCSRSLAELIETKVSGCPECYTVFKTQIEEKCASLNITGQYTGSFPKRLGHFRSVLTDRMFFQTKLEQAVLYEDYEKAALYRDRLKALETAPIVQENGDE